MRTTPPARLSGNNPLVPWLNNLRDFAEACRITSFLGGRVAWGAQGTQLQVDLVKSAAGQAGMAKQFQITSLHADNYVSAKEYDGSSQSGDTVYIYKPDLICPNISSETTDGVTITFTWPNDGSEENNRLATDAGGSEYQVLFPRYKVDQIIVAVQLANVDGTPWIEVAPARVWARRYTQ